jgi:hypothetical protein
MPRKKTTRKNIKRNGSALPETLRLLQIGLGAVLGAVGASAYAEAPKRVEKGVSSFLDNVSINGVPVKKAIEDWAQSEMTSIVGLAVDAAPKKQRGRKRR